MTAARVLALPPPALRDASDATLRDLLAYFEPDGVWLVGPERAPRLHARCRRAAGCPVVHPRLCRGGDGVRHDRVGSGARSRGGGGDGRSGGDRDGAAADVVSVRDAATLAAVPDRFPPAARDAIDPSTATYLVCPAIDVEVSPTALTATLANADALAGAAAALPGEVVALTGALPVDYDRRWALGDGDATDVGADDDPATATTVRVRGTGRTEGYGGGGTLAALTLGTDGTVGAERVSVDAFGLRALAGVGEATARALREAGYGTRAAVADAAVGELTSIDGVGTTQARELLAHAEVLATGAPLRRTNRRLPAGGADRPPLCLDVETDGLTPSIVWQVGVYDPAVDEHTAFVEREAPDEPGRVIEAFLEWYAAEHAGSVAGAGGTADPTDGGRPLLTWNGHGFDYPVLTRFVEGHVPHYADVWDAAPKRDLYHWAVREENALLPARTNKLDHVARRLGYDAAETGLDGAATARAYRRFARDPGPETALDWQRHERYCEDDCRRLWAVYEALRDAERRDPTGTGRAVTDAAGDGATDTGSTGAGTGHTARSGAGGSARTGTTEQAGLGEF